MNKMVAIIQARVGSSRLPGKTLLPLGDRTVLARVLTRVGACQRVDKIMVATTTQSGDDAVVAESNAFGIRCFRGSETDVLARYHGAASQVQADHVIRITSDCPLIDPELIDAMIEDYLDHVDSTDYLTNSLPRTFAHGLDTEIFPMRGLAIAHAKATDPGHREHVTPFFYTQPDRFAIRNFSQKADHAHLRWTLDEPSDLQFFETIVARLPDPLVPTSEVLELLDREPELAGLNSHVQQKSWSDPSSRHQKRVA